MVRPDKSYESNLDTQYDVAFTPDAKRIQCREVALSATKAMLCVDGGSPLASVEQEPLTLLW